MFFLKRMRSTSKGVAWLFLSNQALIYRLYSLESLKSVVISSGNTFTYRLFIEQGSALGLELCHYMSRELMVDKRAVVNAGLNQRRSYSLWWGSRIGGWWMGSGTGGWGMGTDWWRRGHSPGGMSMASYRPLGSWGPLGSRGALSITDWRATDSEH